MRKGLFRPEAIEHQRPTLIGQALLARPLGFRWITLAAVALALVVIVFVCWGEYTRKSRVMGYLVPTAGLIRVQTPESGTIVEKLVSEGQPVRKGDRLLVVSTDRASNATSAAQAHAIATLRARRDSLERDRATEQEMRATNLEIAERKIVGFESELKQLTRNVELQQARVDSAHATVERFESLFKSRFVSDLQREEKRSELLEQQARLQELKRDQAAIERELQALQQELISIDLAARQRVAELARATLELDQQLTEAESRRELVVTAPIDGTVTAILSERGTSVTAQATLLSILPTGAQLQARLLVPSRSIGFVSVGDTVSVRYHAFPYQRFGSYAGAITEISRTLVSPQEVDGPVVPSESVYRVTVALKHQQIETAEHTFGLQAGMQLDADIWLERRPIIEWLFEPLFTVVKKV